MKNNKCLKWRFFPIVDAFLVIGMTVLIILCLCVEKECKTHLLIGFGISLLAIVLVILMHLIAFVQLLKSSKEDIYADSTLGVIIENKVKESLHNNIKPGNDTK